MKLWRPGVAIALTAAAMRAGGLGYLLPGIVWYGLQFGPLLVLGLVEAVGWFRSRQTGRTQRKMLWVVIPATALVAVAALSALWATDPGQTIRQAGILAIVFLFLIATYAHRWAVSDSLDGDLKTVFWTGTVMLGVGVAGYFAGQPWAIGDYERLVGVTPNANYVGMAAAVIVATSFAFSGPWFRVGALIPLVALVLSDSRGGMVGLVLGLAAILIMVPTVRRNRSQRAWIIATGLAIPLLFWLRTMNLFGALRARASFPGAGGGGGGGGGGGAGSPGSTESIESIDVTSGRLDIYREYLASWLQNPWLGTGYRSPQTDFGGVTFEAHNVYLSVLVELGVLGAVVLIALLVGLLVSAAKHAPMIGAAVTALAVEVTESSIFGVGGPAAVMSWLLLFGWAATGLRHSGPPTSAGSAPGPLA